MLEKDVLEITGRVHKQIVADGDSGAIAEQDRVNLLAGLAEIGRAFDAVAVAVAAKEARASGCGAEGVAR